MNLRNLNEHAASMSEGEEATDKRKSEVQAGWEGERGAEAQV